MMTENENVTVTETKEEVKEKEVNKGTGAGGANTNANGKKFEEKTNNQPRLLDRGYIKYSFSKKPKSMHDFYLSKTFQKEEGEETKIIFVLQNGFKIYMKQKYNIDIFRCPDEAYIIEYNNKIIIKILEKKNQNVEGSVETKLWSGPSLKREYELVLGNNFEIQYGYCVSDFLKKKLTSTEPKYMYLKQIINESNIDVLFGDDEDYFKTLDNWIGLGWIVPNNSL